MKKNSFDRVEIWKMEAIWWLVTAVILALVMAPIFFNIGANYPFYIPNILFIVVFVTFTRYIFLLKYSLFSHTTWIKAVLVFLPIPIFLYFIDAMYDFQRFLDEEGMISVMGSLSADTQYQLAKYVQYENLFFGTGAILTCILFPMRMIVSMWRVRNRGTV